MTSRLRLLSMAILTAALAVPAIVLALFDRGGRCSSAVVVFWAKALLFCAGVRVEVEGREHLPPEGSLLFVSSHESLLDIPALYSAVPPRTRFLAKRELFAIPLFGQAIRLLGFVPIDRHDRQAARGALDSAARLSRQQRPLLVFPEGTRNTGPELLPFKRGAFALACELGLPVVPIACLGGGACLPARSLRLRPGRMTLRIGPAFSPERPEYAHRAQLASAVREAIAGLRSGA